LNKRYNKYYNCNLTCGKKVIATLKKLVVIHGNNKSGHKIGLNGVYFMEGFRTLNIINFANMVRRNKDGVP